MDILVKVLQLLLSLSILVIVHEFGHFATAKLFKTKVEKFYLFFNPWFSLFKFKKGDTEYGIGWLPLGGYVKIAGMIDESMDKEAMSQEPQPWEFRSKPAWQRLIIMLGGVIMNVVLAMLIYIVMMAAFGERYLPTSAVKYGVHVDSLGIEMGLQNGDKILSVDGLEVENFLKIPAHIIMEQAKTVQIERNGELAEIQIPSGFLSKLIKSENPGFIMPRMPIRISGFAKKSNALDAGLKEKDWIKAINGQDISFFDRYTYFSDSVKANTSDFVEILVDREGQEISYQVAVNDKGLVGISVGADANNDFVWNSKKYNILEAIPVGIKKANDGIANYFKQLKLLFAPDVQAYKSVGGFMRIGSIFPATWDWIRFWELTAFLSIMLAVLNILPIPALDGGHVLFLIYELIARRAPSDKFLEYAQIVGMFLLFALLILANGNDIYHYFIK
ncbi:MAG: RIP metalloprotease RseP [Bacteroidales bacterium]|jgi:regulator of sigma E protease|nr:RIP metalloprotease RseP [Bacteroidales bacterium]